MKQEECVLGIDPGLTGAIALISDTGEANVIDMPVRARISRKGFEIDYYTITHWIKELVHDAHIRIVYVEQVHAMPRQGVSSSFNFGDGYGAVKCAIGTLGYPMKFVTPAKWKKTAGLINTEKDAARSLAIQLFPQLAEQLNLKKHIGRADALLIAKFGGGV